MAFVLRFPPIEKLGPTTAMRFMRLWNIKLPVLAAEAGISEHRLARWLYRRTPMSYFDEHGIVYDALLDLVTAAVRRHATELEAMQAAHRLRRAAMLEANKQAAARS